MWDAGMEDPAAAELDASCFVGENGISAPLSS